MVNLIIWLYGKPAWDLEIEGEENIDPNIFRKHGKYLKGHLSLVANTTEKLQKAGWSCCGTLYTLEFYKENVTKKETKKELQKLGIEFDLINIEEE